jgi:hypothetical protein
MPDEARLGLHPLVLAGIDEREAPLRAALAPELLDGEDGAVKPAGALVVVLGEWSRKGLAVGDADVAPADELLALDEEGAPLEVAEPDVLPKDTARAAARVNAALHRVSPRPSITTFRSACRAER